MQKEEIIRIGVDVGGTNTDAVLLINDEIISCAKCTTTEDVVTGVFEAIKKVYCDNAKTQRLPLSHITIGSSHLINALLEKKVTQVLAVRLAAPASTGFEPCSDWPEAAKELKDKVLWKKHIAKGGFEYNGKDVISELDYNELASLAREAKVAGISSIAITGVFSTINQAQEKEAEKIFKRVHKDFNISLSYKIETMNLIARENANILSASLMTLCKEFFNHLRELPNQLAIAPTTKIYFSLNDGTVYDINSDEDTDQLLPIFTLHSAFANSLSGAKTIVEGLDNAIIVDIGGTSTDIGVLKKGMVVDFNSEYDLCGVSCRFPSPYNHELALGGGTIVSHEKDVVSLTTQSVGYKLDSEAIVSGGKTMTLTDVAIACRHNIEFGQAHYLKDFDIQIFKQADQLMHTTLINGILHVWNSLETKPDQLVLIGGGANLFDINVLKEALHFFKVVLIPEHAKVANAIGASYAKVKGTYIAVYPYASISSENALKDAEFNAKRKAVQNGALPDTRLVARNKVETLLPYLPGMRTRVKVEVVGTLSNRQISTEDFSKFSEQLSETMRLKSLPNSPKNERQHEGTKLTIDYDISTPLQTKINLNLTRELSVEQLKNIACGANYLGSGGGGDSKWTLLLAENTRNSGHKLRVIDCENLPDDANVAVFGFGGSPVVGSERLVTKNEAQIVLKEIARLYSKNLDAVMALEIGGANALSPFLAARLNLPVVNADATGRAFPGPHLCLPVITAVSEEDKKTLSNPIYVASNGVDQYAYMADSLQEGLGPVFTNILLLGGSASVAMLILTGLQVKRLCAIGSLSTAEGIGRTIRESSENRLEKLNSFLKDTAYEMADLVCSGRITHVHNDIINSQNHGYFILETPTQKIVIGFQNEFLIAKSINDKTSQPRIHIQAPDLITLVDQNTFTPILVQDICYNQKVNLIRMKAHRPWYSPEGLALIQPMLDHIEEIISPVVSPRSPKLLGESQRVTTNLNLDSEAMTKGNTETPTNSAPGK